MKSELVRELSSIEGFEEPKISLEQYMTPPQLAADLIFAAYMQGDIEGKDVVDAGTGTGMLAVGAALLGANVTGVEKDESSLKTARRNAKRTEVDVNFVQEDFTEVEEVFDTCIMNPPFSVHSEEGEQFVEKAFEVADSIYAVADDDLLSLIKRFAESSAYKVESQEVEISLPATYGFHTEESRETEINIVSARKK